MAKLRDIAAGTRAVRKVPLPLVNVRCPLLPDLPELADQRAADAAGPNTTEDSTPTKLIGLRVLDGNDYGAVLQGAREYATARGSKDPKPGDPLYDFGEKLLTVFVSAVDPDSDPKSPEPFFASVDEMLASPHLGRDGILMLAEQQQNWQDLCSPRALRLGVEQVFEFIEKAAAADDALLFFEQLAPGMQLILLRTLAALLRSSQTLRSLSGSTTESSTETSSSNPQRPRSPSEGP